MTNHMSVKRAWVIWIAVLALSPIALLVESITNVRRYSRGR